MCIFEYPNIHIRWQVIKVLKAEWRRADPFDVSLDRRSVGF